MNLYGDNDTSQSDTDNDRQSLIYGQTLSKDDRTFRNSDIDRRSLVTDERDATSPRTLGTLGPNSPTTQRLSPLDVIPEESYRSNQKATSFNFNK